MPEERLPNKMLSEIPEGRLAIGRPRQKYVKRMQNCVGICAERVAEPAMDRGR